MIISHDLDVFNLRLFLPARWDMLKFAWPRNVFCELTAIQEEHGIVVKVFANDVKMHVRIVNDESLTSYIFSTLWTLMLTAIWCNSCTLRSFCACMNLHPKIFTKMAFVGHVLRGSSGRDALRILEGQESITLR